MKFSEMTIDDCELHEWHERDRDCAELRHIETQSTLVIYWDDDYRQAVEDGFLHPYPKHRLKRDLWDMLQEVQLHWGDPDEEITEDPDYEHPMRDLMDNTEVDE